MAAAMFKETELCLGLPGGAADPLQLESTKSTVIGKRGFSETVDLKLNLLQPQDPTAADLKDKAKDPVVKPPANGGATRGAGGAPAPATLRRTAQVVGWPPVRSFRKNVMATQKSGSAEESAAAAAFVKVSIDGAPYLRKVDLKMYKSYQELSDALGKMFSAFTMGNNGAQGMIDFMNERKLMDLLNSSEYVPSYEDKDGDWMLVGDVPWEMFVDSCKRLRIMKGSEAAGLAMEKCKNRS